MKTLNQKRKGKEENKNSETETLKVMFPISLEELAVTIIPEEEKLEEIVIILDKQKHKAEKAVREILEEEFRIGCLDAEILSVRFDYYDSGNITHGAAYFIVELQSSKQELDKIFASEIFLPLENTDDDK